MNSASGKNRQISKKTLDSHHNDKIVGFTSKDDKIKALQNKKAKLQNQVLQYEKKKPELTNDEFDKYIQLQDEISNISKEIINIDKQFDEIDYYINSSPILFKYYDILEKGNQDENKLNISSNSILKYFMPKTPVIEKEEPNKSDDRATLLDKYMFHNSYNYYKDIETENKDRCLCCNSTNRNTMVNDGFIFCNDCCTIENIIIDHDRPSYKDHPKEISYSKYVGYEKQNAMANWRYALDNTFRTLLFFVHLLV